MAPPEACSNSSLCAVDSLHAGVGVHAFARRMDALHTRGGAPEKVSIKVFGSSVGRWHNYLALRLFANSLRVEWPGLNFVTEQYSPRVKQGQANTIANTGSLGSLGGYGPEHNLFCGLGFLHDADVVLVMYGADGKAGGLGRPLLSHLLALPRAPLIVVVRHCELMQYELQWRELHQRMPFELNGSTTYHRTPQPASQSAAVFRAKLLQRAANLRLAWDADSALLRDLRLASVDVCRMLRSLHTGSCASQPRYLTGSRKGRPTPSVPSAFDVLKEGRAFQLARNGKGDPVHPTLEHAFLQGCAAAAIVTSVAKRDAPAVTPRPAAARASADGASWCAMAGDRTWSSAARAARNCVRAPSGAPLLAYDDGAGGWRNAMGGSGGYKRWSSPLRPGASLRLLLPATRPRLMLEHYAHDAKPMGFANVSVHLVVPHARPRAARQGAGSRAAERATERAHGRAEGVGHDHADGRVAKSAAGTSDTSAGECDGARFSILSPLVEGRMLDTRCADCPVGQGFYQQATIGTDLLADVRRALRASDKRHPTRAPTPLSSTMLLVTVASVPNGPFGNFSLVSAIGAGPAEAY